VQYPVNGESKVALILGLIFGLVLPIIVVMLVILICLRRQASKNHHTNRLALLTDNRGSYQPAAMLPPPSEMMADVHHDDTEDKNLIAESSASPEMDGEADGTDSRHTVHNSILICGLSVNFFFCILVSYENQFVLIHT